MFSSNSSDFPELQFPVLLWRDGYMYLATSLLELCSHPRSLFNDTVQRARAGEWKLVDADGRCFHVEDWSPVRPFSGLKAIGYRLLGSIFAVPILSNPQILSLDEFKRKLTGAVRSRYKRDSDKTVEGACIRAIRAADSHAAAANFLPTR